jgi:molecular chaperone DnaJ
MPTDPYNVLGVDRGASQEDIKKAYRKKAHQYHPDKKGGDEARFKEVNEAYQVLGNKERRAQYDQFGHAGASGGFGGGFNGTQYQDFGQDFGGFESIFDMFSGFGGRATTRPQQGEDLHLNVRVTKKDMGKKKVYEYEAFDPCTTCSASGVAPGSKKVTCGQCKGQGRVRQAVRTPFGTFAQVMPCTACDAEGSVAEKKCVTCGGTGRVKTKRKLEVHLPKTMPNRYQMGFPQGGNAGPQGAPEGDLSVTFSVES